MSTIEASDIQGELAEIDAAINGLLAGLNGLQTALIYLNKIRQDVAARRHSLSASSVIEQLAPDMSSSAFFLNKLRQDFVKRQLAESSSNDVKQPSSDILMAATKPAPLAVIEVTKGPGKGINLMTVKGSTAQILGRNAARTLWTNEELKNHMLSPKSRRKLKEVRTDFSPTRKETFKDLFRKKYGCNWLHFYKLAKASLNNRGNEIKSQERRFSCIRTVPSIEDPMPV